MVACEGVEEGRSGYGVEGMRGYEGEGWEEKGGVERREKQCVCKCVCVTVICDEGSY